MEAQRVYSVIQRWEELENCWKLAWTEPGALGLLHAGARLGWADNDFPTARDGAITPDLAAHANDKIDFYIEVAKRKDELGVVASQLIARILLREEVAIAWRVNTGPRYLKLLDFLRTVHDCLRKAPYPGMVRKFLQQSFFRWNGLHRGEKDFKKLPSEYRQGAPLFQALIAWGELASILVPVHDRGPVPMEVIREATEDALKKFIVQELHETHWRDEFLAHAALQVVANLKDLPDLYEEKNYRMLWERAALALIVLKHGKYLGQ